MPTTKILLSIAASFAASAMLIGIAKANAHLRNLSHHFSSQITLVIEEFYFQELFLAADSYLGTKLTGSSKRLKISMKEHEKELGITMGRDEETLDVFENVEVRWKQNTIVEDTDVRLKSYELTFNKKHKEKVLNAYLPYILQQAKTIEERNKKRKINFLRGMTWQYSTEFNHPMTFDTMAMDPELKQSILDDINAFANAKEYCRRIGKAWKRTYLIYGPPGTGKSSLIAAIANHLNYNIYEVDLSDFQQLEDIRELLLHYITRSVLVIKGIDSPINTIDQETEAKMLTEAQKQALLLKLLRVIDGLWLPRGSELVIIIKAICKERLEPRLLMPSRIDMQIQMSHCTTSTLKQLITMYFSDLFICKFPEEIEELLEKVQVTPAEVAAELTKSPKYDIFLGGFAKFLHMKRLEKNE